MNSKVFTYKTNHDFNNNINLIDDSYIKITKLEEIFEYKEVGLIFININQLGDAEFESCSKISNSDIKIIAVITNETSISEKSAAYNCKVYSYIYESADIFEIKILFDNILTKEEYNKPHYTQLPLKLINNISSPIFIKNIKGYFIECNEAFCAFLNQNKSDIIGKKIDSFVSNKKAQIYEEIDKIVFEKGEEKQHITRIPMSNGEIHSAIVNKSPLFGPEGRIRNIIGIVTDISELKKREKELIKQKQKAEEADKLKTSFLSNMSHEIRTPMNAIVGFSQLLAIPNLQDDKKEVYIDQINYNANQLLKLIDDIIEVSKIEAQKVVTTESKCYVNQIIDELKLSFETHKGRLGKTHIELITEKAHSDKFFSIISDKYRLNQILTNLLGNAIKFTEKGYIKFGYKFITKNKRKFLEFFVEDTGLGINKQKIQYVFDRFSKVPADKTKLYGGTGLGLSISKSLTELLGGEISVESVENKGTTFKFTIPQKEDIHFAEDFATNNNQNKNITSKEYNWQNKTLLVAEDEEMNYLFLHEVLKNSQIKIIWSRNGKDAVAKIKESEDIDIVLMDVKMPYMDGYEATKEIKKIKPQIPIIIQTAYAMESERVKGLDAGCNEYIEKPVKQDELLTLINKYLSKK